MVESSTGHGGDSHRNSRRTPWPAGRRQPAARAHYHIVDLLSRLVRGSCHCPEDHQMDGQAGTRRAGPATAASQRFWQGPAPWHFITVPEVECRDLETTAASVSYGWGMIPVTARIGGARWRTSLFPRNGRYLVPVKAGVRNAEGLDVGDVVAVRVTVDV
jgi:Domain of unknown function (DUF1905)